MEHALHLPEDWKENARGFVTGVKLLQTLGASGAILCEKKLDLQGSCNYEESLYSTLFSIPLVALRVFNLSFEGP